MIARVTGALLVALAAALGVLPALTWYAAAAPGPAATASGLEGAGELWALPILAVPAALAGAALLAAPEGAGRAAARVAGPMAALAGALALAWSLRAGADPEIVLTLRTPDGVERVPAAVDLRPAAVVAPVVAGALALVGAAASWVGWRR